MFVFQHELAIGVFSRFKFFRLFFATLVSFSKEKVCFYNRFSNKLFIIVFKRDICVILDHPKYELKIFKCFFSVKGWEIVKSFCVSWGSCYLPSDGACQMVSNHQLLTRILQVQIYTESHLLIKGQLHFKM